MVITWYWDIVELAAAGDIFIFIDYKTTAICQFAQIVFEI